MVWLRIRLITMKSRLIWIKSKRQYNNQVGVVVPPEVVGEGGVAGTVYIPLAAHTRAAVVVDLRGIRRNLIVARPATRAVCRVFILGIGTAPLQRSVGIAAHQIVHQRIPALLRGVDHYADAVLVAEVGSEDIGGIVADGCILCRFLSAISVLASQLVWCFTGLL